MKLDYPPQTGGVEAVKAPHLVLVASELALGQLAANTTLAGCMHEMGPPFVDRRTPLAVVLQSSAVDTLTHMHSLRSALQSELPLTHHHRFEAAGRTTEIRSDSPSTRELWEFRLDRHTSEHVINGLWEIAGMGGLRNAIRRRGYPGVTLDAVKQARLAVASVVAGNDRRR